MPEQFYGEIASRIRQERRAHGLTLEELAHRAALTTSFLGQVERGERKPSLHTVATIARALGMTMAGLLNSHGSDAAAPTSARRKLEALLRGASEENRAVALETVRFVLRLLRRRARR